MSARPAGLTAPSDARQRRLLKQSGLLALGVALLSAVEKSAAGLTFETGCELALAIGFVVLLIRLRRGGPIEPIGTAAVVLVGAYVLVTSLVPAETPYQQRQWFVVIPVMMLAFGRPESDPQRRLRRLAKAALLAFALAGLSMVMRTFGVVYGAPAPPPGPLTDLVAFTDFLAFLIAISGLLRGYRLQLVDAETEAVRLRSILALCPSCGCLNDADHGWVTLETYMTTHAASRLTHGICPSCAKAMEEYA